MVNIEFLVIAWIISLFADWIFQSQWQANNKSKWGKNDNPWKSLLAVISHSFIYSAFTCIGTFALLNTWSNAWLVFLILFISHTIIDTRIPVKAIMKLKGLTDEQINDTKNWGFLQIGIDHRLHEIVLLILAFIV